VAARSRTQAWLIFALFLIGCAPFQHRAKTLTARPVRVVAFPAFTQAIELDAAGKRKPLDAWTDAMAAPLNAEVTRWAVGYGGHMFPETDAMMVPVIYRKFRKWTASALVEIAAQKTGRADFNRHSVDEWRFDQNLAPVRHLVDADFALVTLFNDGRNTAGRIASHLFMGPVASGLQNKQRQIYWTQVGAACLVDLNDGRMVWCNARADSWGDLSVPATARTAVGELLTDLYYGPQPDAPRGAPPVPKPSGPARDEDEDPSP
jgi:hypothetical protein